MFIVLSLVCLESSPPPLCTVGDSELVCGEAPHGENNRWSASGCRRWNGIGFLDIALFNNCRLPSDSDRFAVSCVAIYRYYSSNIDCCGWYGKAMMPYEDGNHTPNSVALSWLFHPSHVLMRYGQFTRTAHSKFRFRSNNKKSTENNRKICLIVCCRRVSMRILNERGWLWTRGVGAGHEPQQ